MAFTDTPSAPDGDLLPLCVIHSATITLHHNVVPLVVGDKSTGMAINNSIIRLKQHAIRRRCLVPWMKFHV